MMAANYKNYYFRAAGMSDRIIDHFTVFLHSFYFVPLNI